MQLEFGTTLTFFKPPPLASRPMGKPKAEPQDDPTHEEMLRRAEASVLAMSDDYLKWGREECGRLKAAFQAASADDGLRAETQQAIFEAAHNLKGQGRSFGFDLVTDVAAMLCALLRDREPMSREEWSVIGHHLDALDIVLTHALRGAGGNVGQSLIANLDRLKRTDRP